MVLGNPSTSPMVETLRTPLCSRGTHHHRLQEGDKGAEAATLLNQGPAHRLLLRLLQQQVHVIHVLQGTVQLGLQVSFPWRGWEERPRWGCRPGPLHPQLRPRGGVPGRGAGHCHGGQGIGEGSRDAGARGRAGPQSRQRGQINKAHRKDTKAAKPPRSWGEQSPGQPQGRPWCSCAQESPVAASTRAETSTPQDTLTAHRMVAPHVPGHREEEGKQDKVERGGRSCRPGHEGV